MTFICISCLKCIDNDCKMFEIPTCRHVLCENCNEKVSKMLPAPCPIDMIEATETREVLKQDSSASSTSSTTSNITQTSMFFPDSNEMAVFFFPNRARVKLQFPCKVFVGFSQEFTFTFCSKKTKDDNYMFDDDEISKRQLGMFFSFDEQGKLKDYFGSSMMLPYLDNLVSTMEPSRAANVFFEDMIHLLSYDKNLKHIVEYLNNVTELESTLEQGVLMYLDVIYQQYHNYSKFFNLPGGAGKTTITEVLIQILQKGTIQMNDSFSTGKKYIICLNSFMAAALQHYTKFEGVTYRTLHSEFAIYFQNIKNKIKSDKRKIREDLQRNTSGFYGVLRLVDEASFLTDDMWRDIYCSFDLRHEFVYLSGDLAQLPPIERCNNQIDKCQDIVKIINAKKNKFHLFRFEKIFRPFVLWVRQFVLDTMRKKSDLTYDVDMSNVGKMSDFIKKHMNVNNDQQLELAKYVEKSREYRIQARKYIENKEFDKLTLPEFMVTWSNPRCVKLAETVQEKMTDFLTDTIAFVEYPSSTKSLNVRDMSSSVADKDTKFYKYSFVIIKKNDTKNENFNGQFCFLLDIVGHDKSVVQNIFIDPQDFKLNQRTYFKKNGDEDVYNGKKQKTESGGAKNMKPSAAFKKRIAIGKPNFSYMLVFDILQKKEVRIYPQVSVSHERDCKEKHKTSNHQCKCPTLRYFPVILADCVTAHMLQGATLSNNLIVDDEALSGQHQLNKFYVIISRVRHPRQIIASQKIYSVFLNNLMTKIKKENKTSLASDKVLRYFLNN